MLKVQILCSTKHILKGSRAKILSCFRYLVYVQGKVLFQLAFTRIDKKKNLLIIIFNSIFSFFRFLYSCSFFPCQNCLRIAAGDLTDFSGFMLFFSVSSIFYWSKYVHNLITSDISISFCRDNVGLIIGKGLKKKNH